MNIKIIVYPYQETNYLLIQHEFQNNYTERDPTDALSGPRFNFQHPHGSSQTPLPGDLTSSSGSLGTT